MLEELKAAQQTLDDLYREHLIPFKLTAYDVICVSIEDYIVHFYDRRLRSVDLSFQPGEGFKDVFKAALLEKVRSLNMLQSSASSSI